MKNVYGTLVLALTALNVRALDGSASVRAAGEAAFRPLMEVGLLQLRTLAQDSGIYAPRVAAVQDWTQASQNYENRVDNPDGSATIVGPRFGLPAGESRVISWDHSDAGGVCLLFGLGNHVASASNRLDEDRSLPAISYTGKLDSLRIGRRFYDAVVCSNPYAPPVPSTQYEAFFPNDDGSVSISQPRFDWRGAPALISWSFSDAVGTCRLFGYDKHVANEPGRLDADQRLAVIDYQGKFTDLRVERLFYKTLVCANRRTHW